MASSVASGRFQCEHCPLSFCSGWQLNGHMTQHRYADKLKKKKNEEQKQFDEHMRMLALLGTIRRSGEAQGSIEMVMLKPNAEFWEVYRLYGAEPKEIDFGGQMSSHKAIPKCRRATKKVTTDTEAGYMDVDLTLML